MICWVCVGHGRCKDIRRALWRVQPAPDIEGLVDRFVDDVQILAPWEGILQLQADQAMLDHRYSIAWA